MLPVEASHNQPKLYVIEEYSNRMVCCESNDGLSIKSQQFLTIQKLSLGNAQLVDRPTQLIYIGISICQHPSTKT